MSHTLASVYKLKNVITRIMTAGSVVDAYVCTTLMQSPFTFRNKTTEGLQRELKELATRWSNRTRRSLSQMNNDIISFCEIYCVFYPRLVYCASQVDDKDKKKSEAARNSFTMVWEILQREVKSCRTACDASLNEIHKFKQRAKDENTKLRTQVDFVISKSKKDKISNLYALQRLIRQQKEKMSEYMTIIVLRAMSGGGLEITVGSLGKVMLGGVSTVVVSSGLSFAGEPPEEVMRVSEKYNSTSYALAHFTKEAQDLSNEFTSLNNLNSDLDRVIAPTEEIQTGLTQMQTLWDSLGVEFRDATQFFDKGSDMMMETLKFVKLDCEEVEKTVKAIQNCLLHLRIDTCRLHYGASPIACIC